MTAVFPQRARFATALPVSNDGRRVESVSLNVPYPMTEAEWDQLHSILAVMKPGFVWEPKPDPEAVGGTE